MNYKILKKEVREILENNEHDLYSYTVYKGEHEVEVGKRDSFWWIDLGTNTVNCQSDISVFSDTLGVMIYGYKPWRRTSEINTWTTLPYVNGCSTTELLPPIRKGDPTFQLLHIPPHTSEQAHHIHSTARVVYVYSGKGQSIIGQENAVRTEPLMPGSVIVLDKMVPHHFVSGEEPLVVLPLHIYSSPGQSEYDHPMMNGTHLTR